MKIQFKSIDYHRNGCSGEGFYAVLFELTEDGEKHNMVATLFLEKNLVAVFDMDLLAKGEIRFFENSWRGDRIGAELKPLLKRLIEQEASLPWSNLGPTQNS